LGGVDVEGGFGPDEEIGGFYLFGGGPLGGEALGDLLRRPAAREQTRVLRFGGTGDGEGEIAFLFGVGFEQKGDEYGSHLMALGAPGKDLSEPTFANARVEDGLEFLAQGRIAEDAASDFGAIEPARGIQSVAAEGGDDFRERRLAGLDDFASENVGIDNRDIALTEQITRGGFAHADAAGYAQDDHGDDSTASC